TATGQPTNQSVTIQFAGNTDQLVDRVQIQAAQLGPGTAIKDFDVQVSPTSNNTDFTTVLSGTYQLPQGNATLQEFVLPGGPVRARFARLIVKTNYGNGNTTTVSSFYVEAAGVFDNVISLPAPNNVALDETPSYPSNGAVVVAYSSNLSQGDAPTNVLSIHNISWAVDPTPPQYLIVQLAGGKLYTLDGVKAEGSLGTLKDFEVWVSTTTTDASAFTRVLSATYNTTSPITYQTFLFPGGPAQARYVKYVPIDAT